MTTPPSPSDLDSDPDEELSRIKVLVGPTVIDVGVPAGTRISAVVNEVIDLTNDQSAVPDHPEAVFDNAVGKWTLARLLGAAFDPEWSLADAGAHDGELLVVHPVGAPVPGRLVDEVNPIAESSASAARWFADNGPVAGWLTLGVAVSVAMALLVPQLLSVSVVAGVPTFALAALAAGVVGALVAIVAAHRSADTLAPVCLSGVSLPMVFGGSLYVLPVAQGITSLPMALALTALTALVMLLVSERGRSLYTAVIALAVCGVPVAAGQLLLTPTPRAVGAILATIAVIVVYVAPRATIVAARLPIPRVPTAGEPLDDIETQGGTAVEGIGAVGKQVIPNEQGMAKRVGRARQYLTGIIAAATVLCVVGCYCALDTTHGFFWQGAAFGFAVATVLCLRGRSHHDLVQSAALIGGGAVIALAVIVKTATFVTAWQVNAAVALVVLTTVTVLCGVVAPQLEFSPVMRRWAEIGELAAVVLVFPLACWIIRLYAFLRELPL
jgi:type VII secretion integral membrane protein EccD